jgi:hypothetical protein
LAAIVLGGRYVAATIQPKSTQFQSVREFREFAASQGLHLHGGTAAGRVVFPENNCYVADHSITFDDLDGVSTRRDCGLTPAWRGILWVSLIRDDSTNVDMIPEQLGGTWRIWGNLVVAGDEALMNRIEELYRTK